MRNDEVDKALFLKDIKLANSGFALVNLPGHQSFGDGVGISNGCLEE